MTQWFRLSILLVFSDFIDLSVHPKMKTNFMETVNLLTTELQLRVEGSNNYHFFKKLFLKKSEKSYLFFKTRLKIFFWFVGFQVFMI